MTSEELAVVPVPRQEPVAVALWGTNEPAEMVARMTVVADAMKNAVEARGLFATINGRKYVLAEGWSLVGAMLGVFPSPRSVDELRDDEGVWFGFRATVDLVNRDGGVVGGAVAMCTRDETAWADRDPNQIASMAQTRATAKAYRSTLGFIMPMAGYAATPAEEMDGIEPSARSERAQRPPARQATQEATDRRNGVPAPVQPLQNIGALFQYGRYHHNIGQIDMAHLFGVTTAAEVGRYVADRWDNNFDLAADGLEQAILEREAQR